MLVIRISDGLVMNYRMVWKNPGQFKNYHGTKKAGEYDLAAVRNVAVSRSDNQRITINLES